MLRTIRKVSRQGGSGVVTLPREWLRAHNNPSRVHLVYDRIILIFPEEDGEQLDRLLEELIAKAVAQGIAGGIR